MMPSSVGRVFGSLLWALLSCRAVEAFAGQPGGASVVAPGGTGVCAWSPLQQQLNVDTGASCELRPKMNRHREGRNANSMNATQPIDRIWDGPHGCVGQFCVFSSPSFGGGTGMVVISTSRSAEGVANALEDGSKRSPGEAEEIAGGRLFEETEIPGKGIGLVARRPIRRGQRIMSQPPVLVVDRTVIDMAEDEQLRLYGLAIDNLPPKTRLRFLAQAVQSAGDSSRRVMDILNTNSFNMVVQGRAHAGNFLQVSRLNHDCRPNLAYHVSPSLSHVTTAVRDIQPGEELTISYLDSFRVRAVRQARAKRNWGFACTCSQCSLPQPLANASDDRLWRIYLLESRLRHWQSSSSQDSATGGSSDGEAGPVSADTIEALLSLYRQEKLDFAMADAYTIAALNYNALDRPDLLDEPRTHWTWRKRVDG